MVIIITTKQVKQWCWHINITSAYTGFPTSVQLQQVTWRNIKQLAVINLISECMAKWLLAESSCSGRDNEPISNAKVCLPTNLIAAGHRFISRPLPSHNMEASYRNGLCCPFIRDTCKSTPLKLSDTELWLLLNSNRKWGFPIQNLSTEWQPQEHFHHFGHFQVDNSSKMVEP